MMKTVIMLSFTTRPYIFCLTSSNQVYTHKWKKKTHHCGDTVELMINCKKIAHIVTTKKMSKDLSSAHRHIII